MPSLRAGKCPIPGRATLRVDFELIYCVLNSATSTTLQKTVAVNGTVRMLPRVPRDLKRIRSVHLPQKPRRALGHVLRYLAAFTLLTA